MARIRGRSGFSIGAVAVAFFWTVSAAQSGQQIPGFFDIFGGLINTAIVDAARRDWQTRPLSDYNCLAKHGVSADQLANRGIGPEDPRVRQILSQCAFAAAPVPVAPQHAEALASAPNRGYVVNGLALGAPFDPQSDPAVGYACHASDDYTGFAWCQAHHAGSRKFGPETIWMLVFRSETNATVEISEAIDPAFFQQGDAEREIQRLSRDFGQQAHGDAGTPGQGAGRGGAADNRELAAIQIRARGRALAGHERERRISVSHDRLWNDQGAFARNRRTSCRERQQAGRGRFLR
jgi:hypothetical protein